MQVLESEIEKKVVRWALDKGALSLKLNLTGNTGWPDRVFCFKGRSVYIEFKRPGEELKRNQPDRVLRMVAHAGQTVGVFDAIGPSCYFLDSTLFSDEWRSHVPEAGMCWIALQARTGKDLCNVYGLSNLAGQGLLREISRDLSPPAGVRGMA